MPKTIYIIRHGETDYNRMRRMQGWLDIPLNEVGHTQAKEAAAKLKGHKVDALYSSDLTRAYQTAEHFAKVLELDIIKTTALRETDMGIFAGWAWESEPDPIKEELWTEFEHARDNRILEWSKHNGESIGQMIARIRSFFEELPKNHADQSVAVVTHGGTINRILEHFALKESASGFHMVGNGAIYQLNKVAGHYDLELL